MEVPPHWLHTLLNLGFAFVLILLNGFFVAGEFAMVKVRRTRLEELAGQGLATARISILCLNDLDEYLSATQLGITLVSLGLGWIGEETFADLLKLLAPGAFAGAHGAHHILAAVLSFFLLTMLHVVLGELVPKNMAIQSAEKISLWISRPLRLFYRCSRPLIVSFANLAGLILRQLGYTHLEEPPFTEQELKLVMKESREDGVISDSEAQIINRAFEFADKRAMDIMVRREEVDYISLARPLDQNLAIVRGGFHTRFPVCETDFDSVIGIVHMKDVWPLLLTQFSNEAFRRTCRPPIFVNTTLRQDQLMRLFQSCRAHLAVVRDPQESGNAVAGIGRNVGIVTMEDVLETLVGEITDEHGN
jgi:CBS domain containing-hemolysin-like protein